MSLPKNNVHRSVAFSSSKSDKNDESYHVIKPYSVDDSLCNRRTGQTRSNANVYDYLQSSFTSNRIVRSNSFHQDVERQRATVQADFASGLICEEDEDLLKYQRARRMSKSLPELNQLRVLPKFADAFNQYRDIMESELEEDDDEDATSSCIATDTEYHPAWSNKSDFLMTIMGFSLGLNTLWRFPYFCYINDGGSFLMAYTILMLFVGLPILCMEYAIGQLTHRNLVVFGHLSPILKGAVISSMIVTSLLIPVYSAINTWSLLYFFKSFHQSPAWSRCNNKWNEDPCIESRKVARAIDLHAHLFIKNSSLEVDYIESPVSIDPTTLSTSGTTEPAPIPLIPALQYASQQFFDNRLMELDLSAPFLGIVKWDLALILFLVWLIVFITLRKGYVFSSNATFCLAIVPTLAFGLLFLKAVFLNGARKGLIFFLKPTMEGLLQPYVWLYAAGFCLHSLGTITGLSLGMAKYHRDRNNFMRDSIVACLINYVSVLVVGCIVFSVIGHLSVERKIEITKVFLKEPGIAYLAMSELLSSMPMRTLWSCIFFFILFCLGVDYEIAFVATLTECVKDRWKSRLWLKKLPHQLLVLTCCLILFCLSLFFITQKGLILVRAVDHYITVILTVILALLEVTLVGSFYGAKNLVNAIKDVTCKTPGFYFLFSWSFFTPLTLMAVICASIYEYEELSFRGIKDTFVTSLLGPTLIIFTLLPILLFGILELGRIDKKGSFLDRLSQAFRPANDPITDLKQGNLALKISDRVSHNNYTNSRGPYRDYYPHDVEEASDYIPTITMSLIQGLDKETAI